MSRIPILILGGTGYVAGEALRLVLGHPQLEIAGILSDSQPGERLATAFPHLAPALGDLRFVSEAEIMTLVATLPLSGVFAAAPHGVSAALIDRLLSAAEAAGTRPRVVDIGCGLGHVLRWLAWHRPVGDVELVGCDLLDSPSAAGPFDCIVSNPPYVRADEFAGLPRDVRDHEPKSGPVAGQTGVEVVERLVEAAESRLATGGWLLVEIGPATAAAAEGIIARRPGLVPGPTLADMAGLPRIVQARKL